MLESHPNVFSRILQINIEMHFTSSLCVDNPITVSHMKTTYNLLVKNGFVPSYIFPQGGSGLDRIHLAKIVENGFPTNLCCFEIGFSRNPTSELKRKNLIGNGRVLTRPESRWKWGQVWGNNVIENVKHSELSKGGRGLSLIKSPPLLRDSELKTDSCFNSIRTVIL